MKFVLWLLFASAFIGCASSPTPPPPVTAIPSSVPSPSLVTATPTAPALLSLPTSLPPTAPLLTKPAVLGRLNLISLPGAGRAPTALALLGDSLYVANRDSDNVAIIRDRHVRVLIPTASGPSALLADAAHSRVYAATYYTPTLSIIENDRIVRTVALSDSAQSLVLVGNNLLVGLGSTATIEIRDPETLEMKGTVKLKEGFEVLLMQADPPRHRLYANAYGWVIALDLDTLSEVSAFEAPYIFGSMTVNPKDGAVWAGTYDDKEYKGYLVAFGQDGTIFKRIPLGPDLRGAAFDSSGRLFITDSYLNRVVALDSANGQVLANVDVDVNPTALAMDDANHMLYIADESSDNVSVIDTSTLRRVGVIPLGMDITALLANPERGRVYAASASTDSVFVIENGQVAGEIEVGHHPIDLARDPSTGRVFVASYADGALTVVDESSLTVRATVPITRSLSSVAVDSTKGYLFAGSVVLSLDTLQSKGVYTAQGLGMTARNVAQFVRANPAAGKIYVFASNGIPGSNSRIVPYAFSESKLEVSSTLPYRNGGNITALTIDPISQLVYGTVTHPLAYTSALEVWDSQDQNQFELPLGSRTSGMVVNPLTHHLFLAHATTYEPYPGVLGKRDNAVQILDTRSLGEVGWLDVPGGPAQMALLGSTVYVAGKDDGAITLIGDAAVEEAPSPTATFTPSPYPTLEPTPTSEATLQPTGTPSVVPTVCAFGISQFAAPRMTPEIDKILGCPTEVERQASFAVQQFEHGAMYYRDDEKRIYILFDDHTWIGLGDTWDSTQPEDSCPGVTVSSGFIKPKRGFGKAWCEQPGVRSKIGGGVSGEIGLYRAFVQAYQNGLMFGPSNAKEVRVNEVFVLSDGGTWQ